MGIINPNTPVFNTIIFYLIVICLILIIKPKFMYSDKENKFKQFGCGEDQTLLSFPIVGIGSGIIIYAIFLFIDALFSYLDKKLN